MTHADDHPHPHRSRSRSRHRGADRARSALGAVSASAPGGRRCAAARAACGPRADHRVATGLGRERRRDLRPPRGDRRSVRPHRGAARAQGQAPARRPVECEDQDAEGNRQGDRETARSISMRSPTFRPTTRMRALDAAARHRPVDRRHLSARLPRPCRRLAGGRPRAAGSRARRLRSAQRVRPPRRWARSPKAGGPSARSRRGCCGPTIAP